MTKCLNDEAAALLARAAVDAFTAHKAALKASEAAYTVYEAAVKAACEARDAAWAVYEAALEAAKAALEAM